MGVTIAAAASTSALWASEGRSEATSARARGAGMSEVATLHELCDASDIIVSICPPASATTVADDVIATGFDGTYVDANAISPATSIEIGRKFSSYVDGGVIGPPATTAGTTRMYLAGAEARSVADFWQGSALDVRVVSESADGAKASALKMAYAGWTKGQAALLLAVNALAEASGVTEELRAEWDLSQPGLRERSTQMAPSVAAKAWRFAGEMEEIAATMASAGVPPGFHVGAAEVYQRLAGFKDDPAPTTEALLAAMLAASAAR